MRSIRFALMMGMLALAPPLAGCAQINQETSASAQPAATVDDDAYCRANAGPSGSSAYVACRKNRDVAAVRGSSDARLERAHRNLAEDMLNRR